MPVFLEIMRPIRTRRMSAVSPRRGQLSGAIPIALQVRKFRHAATRVTVSIGVAVGVVMATVVPVSTASASSSDVPPPDKTALILGGAGLPTPNDYYVETVRNQYIAPTHPGQVIDYKAVTTPEEIWPITGLVPLLGLGLLAVDPQHISPELVAAFFPDEPLWKLSGLFDLTADQSLQAGVADLEAAMATNGNDHLVIFGWSQGAGVANAEKRKLAEQYPWGTAAPDIDFVLLGDPNLPNGGIASRFAGLYIPILDFSFNGPAATDTQFDTVEINRQYDGFADFPLYPLNLVADLNAVMGIVFVHTEMFNVSLPADDPTTSPAYQGTHGDTSYYFFQTDDLPLFAPLRIVGVPEPVIDVVEPFFREVVELGYDRSIPPGEPTPARLIPRHDPATVAGDLVNAVGEGINNAAALIGSPPPLSIPAPITADLDAAVEQAVSAPEPTRPGVNGDVGDGVSQVLTAVGSQLPKAPAITRDDLQASQRKVGRELADTRAQINQTIGAVKSVIGNGRTIVRSAGGDNGSTAATASPARKTPVRDAASKAGSDLKKVVTHVSDSIKKALSGGNDDAKGDGGDGEAQ